VRFEPTPASSAPGGAGAVPAYTHGRVKKPGAPTTGPTAGGRFTTDPASKGATAARDKTQTTTGTSSAPVPWAAIVGVLLVVVLVGVAALVPGTLRRSRRRRRLAGGVEDAWAELRDSAVDLGVAWPVSRSPHETGYLLSGWFGPDPDGPPLVRPPRGRGLAPAAEASLARIVLLLEQVRYARYADDPHGALAEDVRACIAALEHGSTRATLRRARWLPRSLFAGGRRAGVRARLEGEPESVAAGGVVDHVG